MSALALAGLMLSSLPLHSALAATEPAASASSLDLRVLVVDDGGPSAAAIATALGREGVPLTTLDLSSPHATVDSAFLVDPVTGRGRYQAVVLPSAAPAGLSAAELTALHDYERTRGVRQIDAYVYPGAGLGLGGAAGEAPLAGTLDGAPLAVTPAARAGAFAYLRGSLTMDDVDPAVSEVYGYVQAPTAALPLGETFTPLVTVTSQGRTGSLLGAYAHDGREELVLTAGYNASQRWFSTLAHGMVTWMTRGVHLGVWRNRLAVQVDDVFLPDSRWSIDGRCTPGDDCTDPAMTTPDVRMTSADVSRLTAWQNRRGFALDMVFNGGGSDEWVAEHGSDPLTTSLMAAQNQFTWINHTYEHPYLGCVQVFPTVAGQLWTCAQDALGVTSYASQESIASQVSRNTAWATTHRLTRFDRTQLVTGEHSGLRSLPQMPVDNPFLAPALAAQGVRWVASDASRETTSRALPGGATTTVARHPMNVYYNVGTFSDEVSEYNWYYTSVADGGSGICSAHPDTTTCIAPIPAATAAQAEAGFRSRIVPVEVRNAMSAILANDPRPFYAHQSNLAEDGTLYPVVDGILDAYSTVFDTTTTPLVHGDLAAQGAELSRTQDWASAQDTTTAYVDGSGVHLASTSGVAVPLTVPAGTVATGLESYAGERSGWRTPPSSDTVVAVPSTVAAPTVSRLTGSDDASTAALMFGTTARASAVLVDQARPIDGLSAAYIAGKLKTGVLFTQNGSVPAATLLALRLARVSTVYVVGGSSALSASNVLRHYGISVVRISGSNAYDTARVSALAAGPTTVTPVLVGATNLAEAVAAGPAAYAGAPLVLTTSGSLHPSALAALRSLGARQVVVVGGTAAVSPAVVSALAANGITVKARVAGTDADGTAALVASWASTGLAFGAVTLPPLGAAGTGSKVVLVRDDATARMLAVSPAATLGFTVLYTNAAGLPEASRQALVARAVAGTPVTVIVALGSVAAIPATVLDAASNAARGLNG